jgi:hypothetical protein
MSCIGAGYSDWADKMQKHAGALQWAAQWTYNDTTSKQAVVGCVTGVRHLIWKGEGLDLRMEGGAGLCRHVSWQIDEASTLHASLY